MIECGLAYIDSFNMIEEKERIRQHARLYPNTRTTFQTELKIDRRGPDYLSYSVGELIEMDPEKYSGLNNQTRAYIRICETLCGAYTKGGDFPRLAKALVLNYESEAVQHLVENYPLATLSGIRFGTDTMVDQNGDFKTVEVNLGPVGGPPEAIKAQTFFYREPFPISSSDYVAHFIHSLDSFYIKACNAMEVDPKPLEERQLAIVENDEWTPGNFIWLDLLRERGINIEIVPKEALTYDKNTNKINLETGAGGKNIDQIILYFHLQEDTRNNSEEPGDIVTALLNNGTVVESSPLPLIILASKSIAALISQMANDPDGMLAKRFEINPDDLKAVRDMFPKSYHWRRNFFIQMEEEGFSRTDLLGYLASKKLILKSARTNLFAGMGVFGSDNKDGRMGYDDFLQSLKDEIYKRLSREGIEKYFSFFLRDEFAASMIANEKSGNILQAKQILQALQNGSDTEIERLRSVIPEIDVKSFQKVVRAIHQPNFSNAADIEAFFRDLTTCLNINGDIDKLTDKILSYLSTFMLLPFVLQEKIVTSDPTEFRVSGFVGENPNDIASMISTLKRPKREGELKSVHVIVPKVK